MHKYCLFIGTEQEDVSLYVIEQAVMELVDYDYTDNNVICELNFLDAYLQIGEAQTYSILTFAEWFRENNLQMNDFEVIYFIWF